MRYLIVLLGSISLLCFATVPAEPMPLTKKNIDKYGFKIELTKSRSNVTVILHAPSKIDGNWVLVGTQSYPYVGDSASFLSKVSIEKPASYNAIHVFYDSKISDASVGAYYICMEPGVSGCARVGQERLYFIESLNKYGE